MEDKLAIIATCEYCKNFQNSRIRNEIGTSRRCEVLDSHVSKDNKCCDKVVLADFIWCQQDFRISTKICQLNIQKKCSGKCALIIKKINNIMELNKTRLTFTRSIK